MQSTNESADRVRSHTAPRINHAIDAETRKRMALVADKDEPEISARIAELSREWDVERWLETNASTLAMTGLLLGVTVNKKWLIVPGIVLPFLFQHAVQGWCPPLPILRRLGIRTREEIDREKYALKALRGDFDQVSGADADAAYEASRA